MHVSANHIFKFAHYLFLPVLTVLTNLTRCFMCLQLVITCQNCQICQNTLINLLSADLNQLPKPGLHPLSNEPEYDNARARDA